MIRTTFPLLIALYRQYSNFLFQRLYTSERSHRPAYQARVAVDEVIQTIGRQAIETILTLSAQEVAGPRAPGKLGGKIRWHGSQPGRVMLADRQVKVKRPRFRHKQEGEVAVPAYEALQENGATAERMMGALLRGFFTGQYKEVLPEMAETVGVSRSSISGQAIEGSAEQFR